MEQAIKNVRKKFIITAVAVSVSCAMLAVGITYALAEYRLHRTIDAAEIGQLAKDHSELSAYLKQQQPYQAHFETIASIIQKDDRKQFEQILIPLLMIIGGVSALIGWIVSRHLFKPVKQAYSVEQRFMQDAAHELRNPIAAIQAITQQSLEKPPKGRQIKEYTTSLHRQARHLSDMTKDLLVLEHREFRGSDTINISELLLDVLEQLHHNIIQQDIKLNLSIKKNIVAQIDPKHFVLITKNIIENAIKFSHKGGSITITLKKQKNKIIFVVKDTGIGIPAKDIEFITQRFYRASNSHSQDGTGLGMAIVARFINLYKGNITITSKPKKGTTVSVEI